MFLHRILLIASAAVISVAAEANSLGLITGEIEAKSRTARAKVASELLTDVDRLASLVQSPRPSETAWVESEQAQIAKIKDTDISLSRVTQLHKSAEFQQSKVYSHLQEIRSALNCVIQAPPTLQREMFCWSVASFLLDESDIFSYGIDILVTAKRLPEDLPRRGGVTTLEGIQLRNRWFSRGIQQHIMFPYLRGEVIR